MERPALNSIVKECCERRSSRGGILRGAGTVAVGRSRWKDGITLCLAGRNQGELRICFKAKTRSPAHVQDSCHTHQHLGEIRRRLCSSTGAWHRPFFVARIDEE